MAGNQNSGRNSEDQDQGSKGGQSGSGQGRGHNNLFQELSLDEGCGPHFRTPSLHDQRYSRPL